MTKSMHLNAPRRTWTEAELATLRRTYPHQPTSEIAALLGIDLALVYRRASMLGLHKSAAFAASDKSGRTFKGGTLGQTTQFKPGQKSWNDGLSYQPGGRCAQTQFKPGQKPHSTLPVGSYRTVTEKTGRKHLERKTSEAKGSNDKRWTPVARLVWEAAHGPVPQGSMVVFKKGQQTAVLEEITLDRVECITRAQHADRNHPNRSNPELAKLIQLKGQITRQVNRIKSATATAQPTETATQ